MNNTNPFSSRYVTIEEICKNLRVSRGSVMRLLEDGLPHVRLRRQIRVGLDDFTSFMKKRMVTGLSASQGTKRRGRAQSPRQ